MSPLRPFVAALSSLLLLGGCIIPSLDADCPETSSCEDCIGAQGCGFCDFDNIDGVCVPGTALGPDDVHVCAPESWRFNNCYDTPSDEVPCEAYSCSSCADESGCGWCELTGECWPVADAPEHCPLVTDDDRCW